MQTCATGSIMAFRTSLPRSPRPIAFRSNMGGELGVYAQDEWTLDRLTLNLGVAI